MSLSATGAEPYRVVYSNQARERLTFPADVARKRGDGEAFLAALKEFDRRLRLYPQFGEPLIDLAHESGQVWIGTIRPLAMRYAVFDQRRIVMVAAIPVLFPKSELQEGEQSAPGATGRMPAREGRKAVQRRPPTSTGEQVASATQPPIPRRFAKRTVLGQLR